MSRFIMILAALLSLSACASVLGGATQDVSFLTPGAGDSVCFVDNGATKYRVWPPQTLRITRRPGPLTVRCLAEGNREKTVVIGQQSQPVAMANAMNGFGPGLFVDYETGALFTYPDVVTVDFSDMPPQRQAVPHYDRLLDQDPSLFGMEEFRPGDPALMRDATDMPGQLKKRKGASFEDSAAAASGAPLSGGASGATADELTIRMNPRVFAPVDGGPGHSALAGAAGAPVTLFNPAP